MNRDVIVQASIAVVLFAIASWMVHDGHYGTATWNFGAALIILCFLNDALAQRREKP